MSGFVHIGSPLAAVLDRLADGRPGLDSPISGEGHVITAGSPGLVDFHQTSSPTGRTSSPLACSASSGRDRKAASDPV